jgi:hypothetical protein
VVKEDLLRWKVPWSELDQTSEEASEFLLNSMVFAATNRHQ